MSDDLKTKAAIAAGKSFVKDAVGDLMLSPEEREQQSEEKKKKRKLALIKYGAIGVVGLLLVISLVGALASLWQYVLGLAILGGVGVAGYFYAKPKVKALKARATARLEASKAEERAAQAQAEAEARERAIVDAEQKKKQALEDQLAALKKKAGT